MVTPSPTGAIRNGLVIAGADVLWIRDALRELERRARINGGGAPARLRALRELADEVAGPAVAALVGPVSDEQRAMTPIDPISSERAAELLGCTPRYVRLQCERGGLVTARKHANRWTVERAEVLGILEERRSFAV